MWTVVRSIEWLTRTFGLIGAWLVAPLTLAMVWEVFSRYVLSKPTFWAYEVGYMLMGAFFLLGIAYTLQMRRHVRVDFLYDALAPKKQAAIDFVGYVFFLLPMVLWTTWGLWGYLTYAYVQNELSGESAWNPVVWPFRVTFVAGYVLFILQIIAEIIKCVYVLMGMRPPGWSEHDAASPEH